ncbi:NAD(P)-dependent oxidoreductase [Streptomyces durbertensis]|uniref:NAD(P)-dependent oxidoreductase n=1 Tax=Streptomyces durbertensis TaxID=2448886 RepID=A0ABR6EJQ0_9ACTN|nr:NAD(P)-binding domain-containing protein [Streptomyces durbertensis]MBB1245566.1 NAD(P)-dependent oxidoreductase [Streptomyces durbertensis]
MSDTATNNPAVTPTAVTVLGLGPMGRALSRALLAAGHTLTVWNRTPGRAGELLELGAKEAASPADAVSAGDLVIVCVVDYDAAHAVLEPAADALRGRTLVNLTADTPDRARATAEWAREHGVEYLDGAIMSPVPLIGTADAVVLYSGPADLFERHRRTFAALGGTAAYLGAEPGRAAAHDIALLDFFWTMTSGYTHALALARAEGVSAEDIAPFAQGILGFMPTLLDEFARNVDAGDHPGDESTIASAHATFEHIVHVAEHHRLDPGAAAAALRLTTRALAAGQGAQAFSRTTDHLRQG